MGKMGERGLSFAPTQIRVLLDRYPIYIGIHWEVSKQIDHTFKLVHTSIIKLLIRDLIYIDACHYSTNMVRTHLLFVTHTSFSYAIIP